MSGLLSRVPVRVRTAVVLAWAAVGLFAGWQDRNHNHVPVVLWAVVVPGMVLLAAAGVVRLLRSSHAPDRPPFDPFSRAWHVLFAIVASLLGIPVVGLVTHDPDQSPVVGVVMFAVGVVLVMLVVSYLRKPVLDHGLTLREFYADDRRRGRSPTVTYGAAWRSATDPGAVYAVSWVERTREIVAFRYRRLPGRLRLDPPSPLSSSPLSDSGSVEVLGWAESREVLDHALAGWELQGDAGGSLAWVREQLAAAAAATERERDGAPVGRAVIRPDVAPR